MLKLITQAETGGAGAVSGSDGRAPRRRMGRPRRLLLSLLALSAVAGCAAPRPVIYQGGGAPAQADVDECMRLARQAGADTGQGRQVARDTATGAVLGGAATGVYGAVRGYDDIGNRTAAGAAAGAAVGLLRGGMRAREPSATFKGYVNRCLRDRGYDVVGWD